MYYILDQNEEIIGVLRNEGRGCPFLEDMQTNKIAESNDKIWSDSISLKVPYGYDETEMIEPGNHILFQEQSGLWKLYTIYEVSDEIVGMTHHKSCEAFNACIWRMAHSVINEKTYSNANTRTIVPYIFAGTGYRVLDFDEFYAGAAKSYTVGAGTRQQAADDFIKEFDIEVQAYVIVNNGNIIDKVIEFSESLGEETGQRFEFRRSIKGATRTKTNAEFYTKLYVYGIQNSKGVPATITSANKVKDPDTGVYTYLPYIVDDEANDQYNNGGDYLEGTITSDTIGTAAGLLAWGKKQMNYYNHPKYDYTVDVALLGTHPNLGDKIAVIDFEMEPAMTVTARVKETNYSKSDPTKDSIVLGEFTTLKPITPELIWQLQAAAQQALSDLANQSRYRVELLTPDGTDFSDDSTTKRLICRVYRDGVNITGKLDKSSFIWEKIDKYGIHDTEWEDANEGIGPELEVEFIEAGYTIRCNVMDALTDTSYGVDEKDFRFIFRLQTDSAPTEDKNLYTAQYCHYDPVNQQVYWAQNYRGSLVSDSDGSKTSGNSFSITRTDKNGYFIDRMVVYWGGHGSHFGFELINNVPYIYTPIKDWTTGKWWLIKFKYQANAVIKHNSSAIIEKVAETNNKYSRLNVDSRNGWIVTCQGSADEVKFRIGPKNMFDGKTSYVTNYTLSMRAYGVRSSQVYQSCCLDFPYLYVTYGYATNSVDAVDYDWPTLYCINVVTGELLYRHIFKFDGNVQPTDTKHEIETVNYYYEAGSSVRQLLIGFAFDNEDESNPRPNNMMYAVIEKQINNGV